MANCRTLVAYFERSHTALVRCHMSSQKIRIKSRLIQCSRAIKLCSTMMYHEEVFVRIKYALVLRLTLAKVANRSLFDFPALPAWEMCLLGRFIC
jgi:hypothetical protein